MTTATIRDRELRKLPKHELVRIHVNNGGLMGAATYSKWTKDELVSIILQDEGLDPWGSR